MVMKDNPTKKSEEEILNTSSKVYRNGLLWTYGFIRALLEYCSSYEHQNTSRMIRFDDRIVLQMERRDLNGMTPNATSMLGGKQMAVFQLNVFRVCSLVVVIMGSDLKNTNLVLQCGGIYKPLHK
ncbi:hypothetical protein Plhal710r2_c069g0177421 [Plasmopara halstedii]